MSLKKRAVEVGKMVLAHTPYEVRQRRRPDQSFGEAVADLRALIGKSSTMPFVRTFVENCIALPQNSCAQIFQDYFALAVAENKRGGYFVEFGAADGVYCSNSYLLEKEFGWTGIVAEPNRAYLANIQANRQCAIEKDCVYSRSGEQLPFLATEEGTLSTISSFAETDHHDRSRATTYDVRTISLVDLLTKYDAPRVIDYVSVDTEGSEFEILMAFDFSRYTFRSLTVEHNYVSERRLNISDLLVSKGYLCVFPDITQFDDWYVHQSTLTTR